MSALAQTAKMTLADFLAWEEQQPERHEFVDGEIFAMVGASIRHGIIVGNIGAALRARLKPGCRVLQEGYQVLAGANTFYPDVIVMCDKVKRNDKLIERPPLIAEVLSTSTEAYDRGKKWARYREGLPSLQVYLLVSQTEVLVEVYRRQGDTWNLSSHRDLADEIVLTTPACSFTVADIYHDVLDLLGDDPADSTS